MAWGAGTTAHLLALGAMGMGSSGSSPMGWTGRALWGTLQEV